MVRPTVADKRRKQIIEAAMKTIAERGIARTSLDHIADAAGMSRGHVRHFVGNREDLLVETAKYFYAGEDGAPSIMPMDISSLNDALGYFFGGAFTESSDEDAIVLGLVEMARINPRIAAVLAEAHRATRARLLALVGEARPGASAEQCSWAAEGILTAAMGNVFINDFDRDLDRTNQARRAVEAMLSTL
ncbi:TetR/AcrR family transcriptional regulator [Arthrobacter sp. ISL-95]|uniref:TetR/AcrR family transcriptional regulator n=1 Tax=Arthrobacter sp. ISL-95 TaxID=2819116 RepID=UPI001BE90BDB|nr:TetR/AcrR family transcriptional regulator [Arthrobacter sp. ISL-95]MBT2588515.1 TetR family transcriptional regulator [Arthrobacter sp. ISL-95]